MALDGLFIGWAAHETARRAEREMASARVSNQATEAKTQTEFLRADVEKLLMITEALWSVLKEQHGYSDEELIKRVQAIDLRDGIADGKVAKEIQPLCPQCHRTMIRNQPKCLYCGAEFKRNPFER
jgi:hypothetical protein